MLAHYNFVDRPALAYFERRPPQAHRDVLYALAYVKQHARTPEQQRSVFSALEFKCSMLWAMLDALHHAYVEPGHVPPGAFVPGDGHG